MSVTDFDPPLDAGIEHVVAVLRENGIETFESCHGGEGHAYPEPTIRFYGNRGEGFRALAIAFSVGLPATSLRRTWPINDGEPTGPWWEMTFSLSDYVMEEQSPKVIRGLTQTRKMKESANVGNKRTSKKQQPAQNAGGKNAVADGRAADRGGHPKRIRKKRDRTPTTQPSIGDRQAATNETGKAERLRVIKMTDNA